MKRIKRIKLWIQVKICLLVITPWIMRMMKVLRKISSFGLRESLHLFLVFLGFSVKYLSKDFGNILDDFFIIRKWYLYSCSNKEKEEFGAETKFYKSINPTGIINQLHCLTREKSERSSSRLNFLFLFSISNISRVTKKNVEQ